MKEVRVVELAVVEESCDSAGGFGCFSNDGSSFGGICGMTCIGFVCVPFSV